MLVELGNHAPVHPGPDERPKVTTVHIPEFDEEFRSHERFSGHAGHYGHKVGLGVDEFKTHLLDAMLYNDGVTHLPDHEALLAITAAWPKRGRSVPAWVSCSEHEGLTPKGKSADIQAFLSEFYGCPTLEGYYGDCDLGEAHVRKELEYWTRHGAPGEYLDSVLSLPDIQGVYTVDGRIMNNNNDGGDTLAATMMGTGTSATGTTLVTAQTLVTNALAGKRIYVFTTSGNVFVWGNCISNNNTGGASVITVDQWYVPLTPGGAAGSNPGTPWAWVAVDGGLSSSWFCGLATGVNGATNTDHTLATSGNVEYVQAGGTLNRKICPTAVDVSSSARTVTLVPVFTANGTDTLPKTFSMAAFFASMVVSYGGAGGPMKFETAISPTAVISASGDNLTLTETISGS